MTELELATRFNNELRSSMRDYALDLAEQTITGLASYYSLLMRWNARLHLVAPCSPEEFAQRHILESLILLPFFQTNAAIVDVGSGAGLPVIPCLIARHDLSATLIESSPKKSVFLREALNQIHKGKSATIIAKPFENVESPIADFVTCRALDEFIPKVSALVNWAPGRSTLLLFGGETLGKRLEELELHFTACLIPRSEKRFLFEVSRKVAG
jgi:16S rRNA (guanine527-N7)-methyltransferase